MEMSDELYRAVEATQAFLHKDGAPGALTRLIRRRYPSGRYFLEADRRILEAHGLARLDAYYYTLIPALTRTCLSQQWGGSPRLDTLDRACGYVRTLYPGIHVECLSLILLDRRGCLIRSALLQRGAVDSAPFYLAQVLSIALQEKAGFLILAHNHPRGTRQASREDLLCTLRALNALTPLRISLLDHLILAGEQVGSICRSGEIPEMLWTAAGGGSAVAENWLKEKFDHSCDIAKNREN